jgi:hypothetical protein
MKVHELIAQLQRADPEAEVLFLGTYADAEKMDEVRLPLGELDARTRHVR